MTTKSVRCGLVMLCNCFRSYVALDRKGDQRSGVKEWPQTNHSSFISCRMSGGRVGYSPWPCLRTCDTPTAVRFVLALVKAAVNAGENL